MFVTLLYDVMLDVQLPPRSLLTETHTHTHRSGEAHRSSSSPVDTRGPRYLPAGVKHVGQLEAVRRQRLRREVQSRRVHVESRVHGR